jgi:uncharacterized membrane protein (DUF4010 family)
VANELELLAPRAAVALLLGLLVGVERERSRKPHEELFAGIRTFPLIGLLGFLAALAGEGRSAVVFAALALGFSALVVASYVMTATTGDKGATTEIAGLLVFVSGALCFWDQVAFASAAGVVAALLLSLRQVLHSLVARVSSEELLAALKLAVITVVVLPLLPDRAMGPYGAWNPRSLWGYVVLIAAISFAGYVAARIFGARRGVLLTGALGGLTSSTAVTLTFSRRSREEPGLARPLAVGILLASTLMFPRILVIAWAIHPPLLGRLAAPMAAVTLAGLASGLVLLRSRRAPGEVELPLATNPLELGQALRFGALLALIFLVSRWAYASFQDAGLYVASLLAGTTEVDAITVQSASQAREADGVAFLPTAATAILLAALSNTAAKGAMTLALGAPELRRLTLPAFLFVVGVGLTLAFVGL